MNYIIFNKFIKAFAASDARRQVKCFDGINANQIQSKYKLYGNNPIFDSAIFYIEILSGAERPMQFEYIY